MCVGNNHLIWLDCEMTGLDWDKDVILELAIVVTDRKFNILGSLSNLVVSHTQETLDNMNSWCQYTHTRNGLKDACLASTLTLSEVDQIASAFVGYYATKGSAILCGSSVYNDKIFLKKDLPLLHECFHYVLFDLATVRMINKLANDDCSNSEFIKPKMNHRAIDDLYAHIQECKHIVNNL